MLLKLLIISAVLVGLSLIGLAITMLVKPRGEFPETHISRNKEMRKRGITCAQQTNLGCNPIEGGCYCAGCATDLD